MSNAEAVNIIVAIGAVIAATLSALAAFRSARSADFALRSLEEEHLRTGRRDVAQLASSCSFEFRRIKFLAHTLHIIDQANAVFSGGFGGSRHDLLKVGAATRLERAEEFIKTAKAFIDAPNSLQSLVQEDMDRLHVELTMRLSDLRGIADEFDRDSTSREAQMLQHRERAIGAV